MILEDLEIKKPDFERYQKQANFDNGGEGS